MINQLGGAVTNLFKDLFVSKSLINHQKEDNEYKTNNNAKTNDDKTKKNKEKNKNTIEERVEIYQTTQIEPSRIKKFYSKPKQHITTINDDFQAYKLTYDVEQNALVPLKY